MTKDENGLRMNDFFRKKHITEGQKEYIRLWYQSVLKSAFLEKPLETETLKITIFRAFEKPQKKVQRFDRVWLVKEVPAGRWAVLSTREQATQTATHETVPTVPQSHTEEARPQAVASPASGSPASDLSASHPPASDQRSTGKRSAINRQAIRRQAISNPPASDPPASDLPASDPPASDLPASDPPASDQRSTGKLDGEGQVQPAETSPKARGPDASALRDGGSWSSSLSFRFTSSFSIENQEEKLDCRV